MKSLFKGALILAVGGLFCKAMGAFYKIALANVLGATGIGFYQLVFPIYGFALVFVSGGITSSVSRFVSASRAKNKNDEIGGYFFLALLYSLLVGLFFAFLFVLFAKKLSVWQDAESVYRGYYVLAGAVVVSSLLCPFRGLYQGFGDMTSTFVSQVLEQSFKILFGLLFCFLLRPYGTEFTFLGALFGILISELVSFLYLSFRIFFFNKKHKVFVCAIKNYSYKTKRFFAYSLPLTLTALIIPSMNAFASMFVIKLLVKNQISSLTATAIYGIQFGMINSIVSLPALFSTALATSLIPNLSFSLEQKRKGQASEDVRNCFKTIWVVVLPCMIGLYVLAPNILRLAFSDAIVFELFDVATIMLRISSLNVLFLSLVPLSTSILQVLKKTWQAFASLLTLGISYVVFLVVFVLIYGVYGMALAGLFSYAISSVLNIMLINSTNQISMKIKDVLVPVFASIFMGFLCFFINSFLGSINIVISSLICVILCVIFYFSLIFIFKIYNIKNIFFKLKKSQKN